MTELAFGRVAIQKPTVSAEIVTDALATEFGQRILCLLQEGLQEFSEHGIDKSRLTDDFTAAMAVLDPANTWRAQMLDRTDVVIERLGNLSRLSFRLSSKRDEPGAFNKIGNVLKEHNINMTAVDSHREEKSDGSVHLRFDIGIEETNTPWEVLQVELEALGFHFQSQAQS